ncbi:MAG: adenylate kinase [Lachnospiraceae bacterium]|nr:adenylate kinase [Lachnospiraceae bacterium]
MFNIVIFGAPGSGKGTQSERLIDEYGLYHISTGEVLRDHIARGTELGKIADSFISQGQLIPDELMVNILEHELDSNPDTEKGVIFDGFPRTIPQAKALSKMLEGRSSKLHAVVGLEVEDSELMERLVKRGKDSGRSDDNPETITRRLEVYHNQTSPLRDFYMEEGTYHAIPGTGNVDDIFKTIKGSLDKVIELETAESSAV